MANTLYQTQHFIFQPGTWSAEGTIVVLQTGAAIHFDMLLDCKGINQNCATITQSITIKETQETLVSQLECSHIENETFSVSLHHPVHGLLNGEGFYDENNLTWTLINNDGKYIGKAHFFIVQPGVYLINSAYQLVAPAQISVSGILHPASS